MIKLPTDEQNAKLCKLKTLAERGSPGEKEAAQFLLEKLCKKYDVSMDELSNIDDKTIRWFRYRQGDHFRKLLAQCIYKTLGGTDYSTYRRRNKHEKKRYSNEIGANCTAAEAIEIELDYTFFSNNLEREIDRLTSMFIQKNDMFPKNVKTDDSEPSDTKPLTEEDILLYRSIKKQTRNLQIESASDKIVVK